MPPDEEPEVEEAQDDEAEILDTKARDMGNQRSSHSRLT